VLFISDVHRAANVLSVTQPRPDAIGTVRRHPAVCRLIAVQHRRARHDDLAAAHQLPASIRVHAPLVSIGGSPCRWSGSGRRLEAAAASGRHRELIDAGIAADIRLFDTSPMYGAAERLLAVALDAPANLTLGTYDDTVTTSSIRPVVLRNGVGIEDPLRVVLGFLRARRRFDVSDPSRPASFGEPDLRLANRGGARISAAEIAAILERRRGIEPVLRVIAPDASLAGAASSMPWLPLRQLFDGFADIRGSACRR